MAKLDILITAKNEASGVIGGVQRSLGALGSAAGSVAMAAGVAAAAAGAAIAGTIAVGVGKAMDMEQKIADIASVMGLAADETQPLADLITNLGIDPKLKVDATQAADAIGMLGQNGLTMAQIMDGAARSTVLLANATDADFTVAAGVATDTMALFGIEAKDMAKAVNGITGVTIASKFGINDYALALAQGGGVASAVGVSFDDFNTTIAAISPYFSSGSDAGTSFKTFLQRMIPASNEATSAMTALGLITADGANQFFDASGNMRSMSEISAMLGGALAGLTEEQKTNYLSTIFGADAMRAAVAIAESGSGQFDAMAASIAAVNAETSAATRMDTLAGQWEILQGVLDGILTQIGQAFLPALRELANWATGFVSDNGPALVEWFGGLQQMLRDITPTVITWAGVVLGAMGEIGAWITGKATDFRNLGTIWQVVANMASAAAAAMIKYVANAWPAWQKTLLGWANAAWLWLRDIAWPQALKLIGVWATGLVAYLQKQWPVWVAQLTNWANAAWQWLRDDAAPNALKQLQVWAAGMLAYLKDQLPVWLSQLADWALAAAKWIKDSIPGMLRNFGEWLQSLTSAGSDGEDSIGQMVGQWAHVMLEWIQTELVPEIGPKLMEFLGVMREAMLEIAIELGVLAANWGVGILTNLAEALLGMVGIDVSLQELRDYVADTLDGWRQPLRQKGSEAMKAIGQGFEAARGWTMDRWDEALGIFHKHLDDGFQMADIKKIGGDIATWIGDGIKELASGPAEAIKAMATQAWGMVTEWFSAEKFKQIGIDIMQGLADGMNGMLGQALAPIQALGAMLPQWLKDQLGIQSPSRVFAGIGEHIMEGLAMGMDSRAWQPVAAMAGATGPMMAGATTNNYNNYSVNLSGSGRAGADVMATVQLLQTLYG